MATIQVEFNYTRKLIRMMPEQNDKEDREKKVDRRN